MKLAEVALVLPIYKTYTYKIPDTMEKEISIGSMVVVPVKNKHEKGFVISLLDSNEHLSYKIKEIKFLIDTPPISKESIELAKEISTFFINPIGMTLNLFSSKDVSKGYTDFFKITEKGSDFIKKIGNEKDFNFKILSYLEKSGLKSINQLKTKFSGAIFTAISNLLKKGLIEKITKEIEPRKGKKQRYCELLKLPDKGIKITDKQQKVIEFLLNIGKPVPISLILNSIEVTHSPVKSLEKKGILKLFKKEVDSSPFSNLKPIPQKKLKLNKEQEKVFKTISEDIKNNKGKRYLLHGVTGSGKTLVYIELIKECIKHSKSAIMLVPEISLTPQMAGQFLFHFKENLALFHSMLTSSERLNQWKKVKEGKAKVILGTRSALFLPVKNLGLIIIDEEHDSSYIQENLPIYNTIWIAEKISKIKKIPLILGSATPSISNYYRAQNNKLSLLQMKKRVEKRNLPEVKIVDMTKEFEKYGKGILISSPLKIAISETLKNREQVILLLNRRGFAPFVLCRKCGYVVTCKNCNISMTYHKRENRMICHYCGHFTEIPKKCPECGSKYIYLWGIGTEKLEEALKNIYKNFKISRFDRDTTRKKGSMEKILREFKNGKTDILIGTQMIAKGHDFPNVTLVGVLSADLSLKIPNFDSAEKTFQLLTQVAGRSGRGEKSGRVIIQTYYPNHYAIKYSRKHDYISFYNEEIVYRKNLFYPPFSNLIVISSQHKQKKISFEILEKIAKILEKMLKEKKLNSTVKISGPVEAGIEKVNNQFIHNLLIRILEKDKYLEISKLLIEKIMQKEINLSRNLRFNIFF